MSQPTSKSPTAPSGARGKAKVPAPAERKSEVLRGIDVVPTVVELRADLMLKLFEGSLGSPKMRTNMAKRTLSARQGLERVILLPRIKDQLDSDNADEVAQAERAIAKIRSLVLPRELQNFDGELDAWLTR